MLGFFVAFAVKLPVVPLHTWLPDAHTEAPTAGSVILAGLLLKTGAYGLMRFVIPLFPHAAHEFTPVALVLAVIGIVYGAVMAFSQTDLKRLVAYTSVSSPGVCAARNFLLEPACAPGRDHDDDLSRSEHWCDSSSWSAAYRNVSTLAISDRMGGLWAVAPRLSAVRALLQSGLARPARTGRFRRRVSRVAGRLQDQRHDHGGRESPVFSRPPSMRLRMVQRAFQGPNTARLATCRPDAAGRAS